MQSSEGKPGLVLASIGNVMRDIGAIGKDQQNKHQGYMFRGIDQVYDAVHPLLVQNKLVIVPKMVKADVDKIDKGYHVCIHAEFSFVHTEDGSIFTFGPFIGEAADFSDKAASKAMSMAYKYFIFQAFCIPLEEGAKDRDGDFSTPEVKHNNESKDELNQLKSELLAKVQKQFECTAEDAKLRIRTTAKEYLGTENITLIREVMALEKILFPKENK